MMGEQTAVQKMPTRTLRYLIDADGFQIDGQFLPKEVAVCDLYTRNISLYRFKVGKFNKLSEQNRKQVVWVRNNIHGLDFIDGPLDASREQLDHLISIICINAEANNELIGYKGGRYEFNMLSRCGYAHLGINIEMLGCPRLDLLIDQNPHLTGIMCAYHRPLIKRPSTNTNATTNITKIPHCPQMEVAYFMDYLIKMSMLNSNNTSPSDDIYSGLKASLKPTAAPAKNILPQQQQPNPKLLVSKKSRSKKKHQNRSVETTEL